MVTTTDTDEDELELEEDQKKKSPQIGKTIQGPPLADKGTVATTIGTPIQPGANTPKPAEEAPPQVDPSLSTPTPTPGTISGMGPLTPQAPMTPKPQFHGLNRFLDTIAGATKIGSAIESAGNFGTVGWRQQHEDEQKQLEDAAKLRQQGANTEEIGARAGLAGAQAGEAEARGEAAKSAAGSVGVTVNGVTYTVPQKDAEKLIGTGITTQAGKENTDTRAGATVDAARLRAGATARHNVKVMGDGTYEEMNPGQWTKVGEAPPRTEQGNYVPINDEAGNTTGWVNPKSHTVIKASEIPGMTGEQGAAPSGSIPAKPTGQTRSRMDQAEVVTRAGGSLIEDIQKHRDSLGTLSTWVAKYGIDTPIGDPELAGLQAELASFAALQPAMHGFRGSNAMDTFQKIIGELQKNPDATIASIQGILKVAGAFNPTKGDTSSHPAGGGTSQSAPAHKVGETVSIKGKSMKITQVHPDGSFDAQ